MNIVKFVGCWPLSYRVKDLSMPGSFVALLAFSSPGLWGCQRWAAMASLHAQALALCIGTLIPADIAILTV